MGASPAWWKFYLCALIGLAVTGCLFVITDYYTSTRFGPVKRTARASQTGHATNIIQGLASGLQATAAPSIVLAMGILNPLLAVLPLIQEGKEKESPCAALIAEATKSAKQSAQEAKAGVPRPPAVVEKPRESAAAGGTRREQDSVPASPPQ